MRAGSQMGSMVPAPITFQINVAELNRLALEYGATDIYCERDAKGLWWNGATPEAAHKLAAAHGQ